MLSKLSKVFLKPPKLRIFRETQSDCHKNWKIEPASSCDRKEVLTFVEKNFLKDDPLANALIPGEKPAAFNKLVREAFDQGFSVVAKRTCGDFEVIGACINCRSFKVTGMRLLKLMKETEDQHLKKILQTMAIVEISSNVNDKLNQDEIFLIGVLSVNEKHWGKGIGLELVRKSIEVAREKNFKFAKMNCMNENTRKIAEEVKMTRLWCLSYKSLLCRGDIPPRAHPADPHIAAYVYYIDLMKDSRLLENCE